MQQLYKVIKERFDKLHLLSDRQLTLDEYRELREEERLRCEKEGGVLANLRNKKSYFNLELKNYQCMRAINTAFTFDDQVPITEESFLNDFVCLYSKFFDLYEGKFQFKIKMRSLLRPTNHHIVLDLVKYLADFSRDYTQHLFLWHSRQLRPEDPSADRSIRKSHKIDVYYQSCLSHSQKPTASKDKPADLDKSAIQLNLSSKRYSEEPDLDKADLEVGDKKADDSNDKKHNAKQLYLIMNVQPVPFAASFDRVRPNIEIVKARVNQLFKNSKSRNTNIKGQIDNYYSSYNLNKNPDFTLPLQVKYITNYRNKGYSHLPFSVHLVIEKNGASFLNITPNQCKMVNREDKSMSPMKEKLKGASLLSKETRLSLMPSSTSKSSRNEFIVNSLRVLRISENFLPPVHQGKEKEKTPRLNSEEEQGNPISKLLRRLSSSNTESAQGAGVQAARKSHNSTAAVPRNEETGAEKTKMQKRRYSEMKKYLSSEDKNHCTARNAQKKEQEDKIIEWMDKISLVKQMERKKILGLGG